MKQIRIKKILSLKINIILIFSLLIVNGCLRQNLFNGKAELKFSTDTLLFDTVFTHIGSATLRLKIYNPYNQPVKINKIYLGGGKQSPFRLNINGFPELETENIILDAADSMYIFAEVVIDPTKDPLTILDSIIFITENNTQNVKLFAVGKDVNFINGKRLQTQTWTSDKPYLIYNSVLVDSGQVLTIEAGTQIYSHRRSYIYVYGTLNVQGEKDNPVLFCGDRLEQDYNNVPGQWGGIRLLPGSHDNFINYAIIKDAVTGVEIDTLTDPQNPNLIILNSKIQHHSFAGIYALATKTIVANTIVSDCGYYNVALFLGGEHYFLHCTIYNDYKWVIRKSPAVAFNNYLIVDNKPIFWGNLSAYFVNSIIYGDADNEFVASSVDIEGAMAFTFENCLMKLDLEQNDTSLTTFLHCIVNQNPEFVFEMDSLEYYDERDYSLQENSPAVNAGNRQIVEANSFIRTDIEGYDRLSDGKPDLGAYELQK